MKILKKKKKFFFFFQIGKKSHLNPIGKGAEFRPLRTPKKIPATPSQYAIKWSILVNTNLSGRLKILSDVFVVD